MKIFIKKYILDIVFVLAMVLVAFTAGAIGTYSFPTMYDTARYMENDNDPSTIEDKFYDDVVTIGIQTPPAVKLIDLLPKVHNSKKGTPFRLAELNSLVNRAFAYRSDPSNFWYTEKPLEALLLGSGDCKSYANFKYHLLKQLGYKNVKIIGIVMADGTGALGGHVITLVDDLWVMDINPPYFYPFAYLRASNAVLKAYDETGVRLVRRGWW